MVRDARARQLIIFGMLAGTTLQCLLLSLSFKYASPAGLPLCYRSLALPMTTKK